MASYSITTIGDPIALVPNLYEIRFTGAVLYNASDASPYVAVNRYSGTSVSGGTLFTPCTLSDGGPTCSASVYYGGSMSISGTKSTLFEYSVGTGTASSSGIGAAIQSAPAVGNQDALLPISAQPGTTLHLYLSIDLNPNGVLTLFFEEMHLPGSY